jgi:hypothetical protein
MFENFKTEPGIEYYYNELENINEKMGIKGMAQRHLLDEDIFQVSYIGKYTIDVGWYPAFKKKGSFPVSKKV